MLESEHSQKEQIVRLQEMIRANEENLKKTRELMNDLETAKQQLSHKSVKDRSDEAIASSKLRT